jgi:hypothetical protein
MGRVSGLGRTAFLPVFGGFFNSWDEEISIPETHGPFGNFIPVGVKQAIFLFHASI